MEQGRSDEARDHLGEAITKAKRKYLNWECAWEDDKRIDSLQHEALSALMNKDYDGAKEHFQSILKLLNASDVFYPGINNERGASIHGASCFRELAKASSNTTRFGPAMPSPRFLLKSQVRPDVEILRIYSLATMSTLHTSDESKINNILKKMFDNTLLQKIEIEKYITVFRFQTAENEDSMQFDLKLTTSSAWWVGEELNYPLLPDKISKYANGPEVNDKYLKACLLVSKTVKSATINEDLLAINFKGTEKLCLVGDRDTGYDDFGWQLNFDNNSLYSSDLSISSEGERSWISIHPIFEGLLDA